MRAALVSIMMPAYNAEAYIGQAIESVLAQTYDRWELVVVDDGSTDQTAAVACGFRDERIALVRQANAGEAAARNAALKHLSGEYVAFLDSDDAYEPAHLDLTVGWLRSHPERDGVYTDGYYCDCELNRLQTLSSRRRGPFEGRVFEQAVYASDIFGPPGCVVLRRAVVVKHGLEFDEDLFVGTDWDFLTKFSAIADFGYLDRLTYLYRLHTSNVTTGLASAKRLSSLAKCRLNATQMPGFGACSPETRVAVYYDLLVNLLRGSPERQSEVVGTAQFRALPFDQQARLVRLMAARHLLDSEEPRYAAVWLEQSRRLNPADKRGALLSAAYRISPTLCRSIVRARTARQPDPRQTLPFADVTLQ